MVRQKFQRQAPRWMSERQLWNMIQTVTNLHQEGRIEPSRIYEGFWHFSHAFLYNVKGLHESAELGNILKLHTYYFEDKSYTINLLLSAFNDIC